MSHDPADDGGLAMFDEDDLEDGENRTVVDNSFWSQPKIPAYPALAIFGRFEILGRIARGGMAEVFLAREAQSDGSVRHVVLKRVLPEMADNPDFLSMFLEEGRTAVRLYHANVCHVYESGEVGGTAFMALEWVYGTSLDDVITRAATRGTTLPWPIAVEIVAQVASALEYVHHAKGPSGRPLNIVHRDVSPHNVMLSWTGSVKLLDFGIAKTSANEGGGETVGKYGYMSPEQAQSRAIDARSDLFALGVVLFEALTGRPLYDRPTVLETLSAIVREPVPSLAQLRPDLPPALDHIVARALAKSPAQRWESAGELRAALKQVLRAHNQLVIDKRIALTIDGLFTAAEKAPLKPDARALSGSFAALSAPADQVTYETFKHESEPPPSRGGPSGPSIGRSAQHRSRWSRVLLYAALVVLFAVAAGIGAATMLWLRS
jgi:serine/threonine-protein kinase